MESTSQPSNSTGDSRNDRGGDQRTLRLLIVEDRPEDAELAVLELRRAGFRPDWTRVDTLAEFVAALEAGPEVVLCDYSLPTMTAPDALAALRERESDVPLIVISGVMDEDTCVTSLRLGAIDYLLKDRMVRLGPAVEHALNTRRLAAEARREQAQRRRSETILRGVLDRAPAAICVREVDGTPLLSNDRYDLLVSADVPDPMRLDATALLDAEGDGDADGGRPLRTEQVFTVDGAERTYLCAGYPIVDADGQLFALGTIGIDISEQKEVEARLREVDRLKGEFVASVSHELRTPLTSICGYAEMLLGDPRLSVSPAVEPTPERRMIEVIDRNGRRLLSLVDDLLTLSRVDAGAFAAFEQQVDLAEVVRSAVTDLTPSVAEAQVELDVRLAPDLPAAGGDRSQLERVVLNLLTNAVKFSDPGATVTVVLGQEAIENPTTGDRSPALQLAVIDTGFGIPLEEQPKLFTRFFRTKEAQRRVIQGTGLGLAVVKEIVERHGGTVAVRSAVGEGTTMTVLLPAGTTAKPGRREAARAALLDGPRVEMVNGPSFPAPRSDSQPARS